MLSLRKFIRYDWHFKERAVFDSLGEICEELGDSESALKNYEQSLKLDPQNKNAEQHIKKLRSGK